jgi:hypothetical protein
MIFQGGDCTDLYRILIRMVEALHGLKKASDKGYPVLIL